MNEQICFDIIHASSPTKSICKIVHDCLFGDCLISFNVLPLRVVTMDISLKIERLLNLERKI